MNIKQPVKMSIGDMEFGQTFRNKNKHYVVMGFEEQS